MSDSSPSPRRPWPLAVAILVCAGIGAVVVERLTRPVDQPPPVEPPRQAPGRASVSRKGPSPDSSPLATPEELIVQVKQLADRLLESLPEDPGALTLAGEIYHGFGEPARAAQCWDKCTRLHPEFSDAWGALGAAAREQGDFAKAAGHLQRAYALNPKLPGERLFLLAESLMNTGKPEETVALVEQLRKTQKVSAGGLVLLGQAYLELKEYEKAKREFEAVLAVAPDSASAHFALGRALARLGQSEKAQQHREQYSKLKDRELAQTDRNRVDRLKTDLVRVHPVAATSAVSVGKVYALHGRVDEAERLWLWAAAVDPQNSESRKLLEVLYHGQGRRAPPTPSY